MRCSPLVEPRPEIKPEGAGCLRSYELCDRLLVRSFRIELASGSFGFGKRLADVQPNARTHRTRQRQRLQVDALDAGRLGAIERIDEGQQILLQLLIGEALLADDGMHDTEAVVAELDATALEILDDTRQIFRRANDRA